MSVNKKTTTTLRHLPAAAQSQIVQVLRKHFRLPDEAQISNVNFRVSYTIPPHLIARRGLKPCVASPELLHIFKLPEGRLVTRAEATKWLFYIARTNGVNAGISIGGGSIRLQDIAVADSKLSKLLGIPIGEHLTIVNVAKGLKKHLRKLRMSDWQHNRFDFYSHSTQQNILMLGWINSKMPASAKLPGLVLDNIIRLYF